MPTPCVITQVQIVQLDQEKGQFDQIAQIDHPYPTTKIIWVPDPNEQVEKDLFATTGDYLRIWKIDENNQTSLECLLNNVSPEWTCAAPQAEP